MRPRQSASQLRGSLDIEQLYGKLAGLASLGQRQNIEIYIISEHNVTYCNITTTIAKSKRFAVNYIDSLPPSCKTQTRSALSRPHIAPRNSEAESAPPALPSAEGSPIRPAGAPLNVVQRRTAPRRRACRLGAASSTLHTSSNRNR